MRYIVAICPDSIWAAIFDSKLNQLVEIVPGLWLADRQTAEMIAKNLNEFDRPH